MNVLIFGGGAVGLGIASCLIKSGEKIDIIARENTISSLCKSGLLRRGIFGDYYAGPNLFNCYSSLKQIPSGFYDYVLVSTKSFDSYNAAKALSKYNFLHDKRTKIILFQNGWGNAEVFLNFFPKEQIYNARVITGFSRPQKNEVVITVHADAIHIGSLFHKNTSDLSGLCQSISQGGVPCELTDFIEKDLWAKMLYNCALNGLGAILTVPYGILGEYDYSRNIMKGIVEEIFKVIKIAGYKTHWESAEDYLKIFYEKLLPSTAKHESSTLQDIRAKKQTEINALNGSIIQLARKYNIEIPYNFLVYNMVKFIEARNFEQSNTHDLSITTKD